jgi:hypothetical protein
VNRWKQEGMPRLSSGEEQQKAMSFLNQRGFENLNIDDVQLWFTIFRNGELAKYRDRFQQTGSNFFRLTKDAVMKTVGNIPDGDALFTAIQEGM